MARYPVSTTVGDRENRPLLRFDTRRNVLASAIASFGGRKSAAVTAETDGLTVDIGVVLTPQERSVIAANRNLTARLNKIVDNAGARIVDMARKESRPTYRTGLFFSSWKATKAKSAGGLSTQLDITNAAPYALYVYRRGMRAPGQQRGWPTVINRYIRPQARRIADGIVDDIVNDRPLMDAIRDAVLSRALGGGR
jgi:hypothetical protein